MVFESGNRLHMGSHRSGVNAAVTGSGRYEQVDEPKPDEAEQDLPQTKVQTVKNMKRTEKAQVKEGQEPAHE
ncbi:hypothetical protein [Paenibacillus sp. 1-18]|uniref:hypothetical protein n=1 Tax=Paenibacillus sp. 1-18 TaxID=1333846 RepID=UPI0004BCC841|nr:hypothetical protein [Paenibacillus sp. 1-18]